MLFEYQRWLFFLWLLAFNVQGADIGNPQKFLFAGDKDDNIIDIVDLAKKKFVHRIKTDYTVDSIVVTPYAPLLFYTNIENKVVVAYNLETQKVAREISLDMVPRNMVLDTTGTKIAITDSEQGGFVLLSTYHQAIAFELADFPATTDVLFDPNEIDIYYSNDQTGAVGIIDINLQETFEMQLEDGKPAKLSSPSRSLDGRYVYVANQASGEVYGINAYSKIIYKTFTIGTSPARPYTTPEGTFLYLLDDVTGRFVSFEQHRFTEYTDIEFNKGIDLVAVGRFDRLNLFLSSSGRQYHLYDNLARKTIATGHLRGTPVAVLASADGRTAYVALQNSPQIAALDLESQELDYIPVTNSGIKAFALGLSNTVCH